MNTALPFLATVILLIAAATGAQAKNPVATTTVKKEIFGKTTDGEPVEIYTLTNGHGLKAKVMTWGAGLVEMHVPDRDGKMADVTLGFDKLDSYLKRHPYLGCTTGRYCNRIAKGKFTLDGQTYTLATNNGPNHLHGGVRGFDQRNWKGEIVENKVRFSYTSPDGEEGYPGTLKVAVFYALLEDNALQITYQATTDKPTVVNLTNHSYWNLKGTGEGDILDHELTIHANRFTAADDSGIPTGNLKPVADGPLDFNKPKVIGKDFAKMTGTPGGYDLNYVINEGARMSTEQGGPMLAAEVREPKSGRVMQVITNEPGIQFYTGNYLDGSFIGKGGKPIVKNSGLCLETQHYPDSPNHPNFPTTVLRPGKYYQFDTHYRFTVR